MSSPTQVSQTHVLRRLLALAWAYRERCALVLATQLLLLWLTALALAASGLAVNTLQHALVKGSAAPHFPRGLEPPVTWSAFHTVLAIAAAIAVMGVLRAALSYAYTVVVADLVQGRIVPQLRAQVYEKLQALSFRFYDQHKSGALLNRVTSDVQSLRSFVDAVLIQGLVLLLTLAVYGAYMMSKHVGLTCVCLANTPLLWWLTARFSRRVIPAYARSRERLDELVLGVSEALHGVQVIKGFAVEPHVLGDLDGKNARVRDSQAVIFEEVTRYTPRVDFLIHGNMVCLLCYGGLLVADGSITLGDLVVFAGLLAQFSTQVNTLATIVNTLQESLIGAKRVFEVLDTPSDVVSPARPRPLPALQGHVRFDDVSFAYEPDAAALRGISFEARPGELIAIYGASGAGKTSLLSLIPRFYDPGRGRVLIDGIDVRELDLNPLRRGVAMVFQETFLFSHTVAANIALGRPDASPAQIEQAARLASAHEFIQYLPHGYQTLLGELATNLSGGQRQRLALARALLTDPRILLLDDPTAALDAETTRVVLRSLQRAAAGRTTLLVSHRPAVLQQADRILVLEQGRLVQQGSHAKLCLQDGPYRELLRLHETHEEPTLLTAASP